VLLFQKIPEFQHAVPAEHIVLCSINQSPPDNDTQEENPIFFSRFKEMMEFAHQEKN
jgi:hypothetical protein